jgi:PAS domain S-box-containing protein
MTTTELLESLPMAALVTRGERVLEVNERVIQLLGYTREELLATPSIYDLTLPEDERERVHDRYLMRMRGEPQPPDYLIRLKHKSGREIPARTRVAFFPAMGPDTLLSLFSDESERERAVRLVRGFVDVAVAAMAEHTQEAVLRVAREKLAELGLHVAVMEVQDDRFRVIAQSHPTPLVEQLREQHSDWIPISLFGVLGDDERGLFVDDLPTLWARALNVPVSQIPPHPGQVMVARIYSTVESRFVISCSGDGLDRGIATALGLLGRQLGAALAAAQRIEETQARNNELSLLLDLGRAVMGGLDVREVLRAAARTAARTVRCACAYLLLPDARGDALRVAAREDPLEPPEAAVGTILPLSLGSLSAIAFRTAQPQTSSDNTADSRVDPEVLRRFRCRATLAVPLMSHGRPRGVLALFERGDRSFDAMDLRLATHAAQLIATALENARLYDEQRERAEEMALLNDLGRRLAGSLEVKPLLELGGETMRRLFEGESWLAFVPDARTRELRFDPWTPEPLRSAARIAFNEGRLLEIPGALVLPLLARGETLGVLLVRGPRALGAGESDLALSIAGTIALALLSARLYQDLRQSYAELARAQAELIDRERLAALGELSASIAHEVRNPLGVIFNSVGTLRKMLEPKGDVAMLLDVVGEEATRLNRMVGDLLDYSRPIQPALQPLSLRPLLEEALRAARQQIGPATDAVQIDLQISSECKTLRADARLLRQALVNLLLNAYQAMPRGGRLEVRASRAKIEDNECAEIAIRDSGSGIPPEAMARIFQPFFTTKAMGTGLGLAVVRRIVEGHGGVIALGRPAMGAEFLVRLPLLS